MEYCIHGLRGYWCILRDVDYLDVSGGDDAGNLEVEYAAHSTRPDHRAENK